MNHVTVISLGGSLVCPDKVDDLFLAAFSALLTQYLSAAAERRVILVTGGGALAREYQRAYYALVAKDQQQSEIADWLGISATRLNAELVRRMLPGWCVDPVVHDPEGKFDFTGRVLTASGWKPGFSTDYVSVVLAERFRAELLINPTNIERVYSDDPRKNPDARPFNDITWKDYRAIVGEEWTPGKNAPFDPVASVRATASGLKVVIALGKNLANLNNILEGRSFIGTLIHP
jgi:uridylate kinase